MCSLWHNAFPAPCLNAFANCRLWTLIRSEASKRRQNPRDLKQHRFRGSMLNRLHSTVLWHWGGTAVTACVAPGQIPINRKEADKLPPAKENGINASQNRPVLGESLFMELPPARRLHQVPARAVLVIFFSHSNWPYFTYNSRPWRGPVMTRRSWPRHYALSYADTPPLTFNPRPKARGRPLRRTKSPADRSRSQILASF